MAKLAIKSETCKQKRLFPLDLEEMIPKTHIVRVVDMVIDRLDISPILPRCHVHADERGPYGQRATQTGV